MSSGTLSVAPPGGESEGDAWNAIKARRVAQGKISLRGRRSVLYLDGATCVLGDDGGGSEYVLP